MSQLRDAQLIQRFEQLRALPLGPAEDARDEIAASLNQVLSDTRILHGLYKNSHWLMRGATFYQTARADGQARRRAGSARRLARRAHTDTGAIAVGDPGTSPN
jgi:starvation-inducible DNA-binding protein